MKNTISLGVPVCLVCLLVRYAAASDPPEPFVPDDHTLVAYSARIDEVRVSDCVRYDPDNQSTSGRTGVEQ